MPSQDSSRREPIAAFQTGIRLDPRVSVHMVPKVSSRREPRVANVTREPLNTLVKVSNMSCQLSALLVPLAAEMASVQLARVETHVLPQAARLSEGHATNLTGGHLLPGVNSHVTFENGLGAERLVADFTRVRSLPGVRSHVDDQMGVGRELLLADLAGRSHSGPGRLTVTWLLGRWFLLVGLHVLGESTVEGELHITFGARVGLLSGVHSGMFLQQSFIGELLIATFTRERLLLSVGVHMTF